MQRVMGRWEGKVAVITGASAGIGAAIAEILVQNGLQVVGLARRKEKMVELALKLENQKGKFHAVKADVTKEDDILKAFDWVQKTLGPINILINNAGVVRVTTLIEGETKLWKDVLDTNVLGLCIATREAVKDMIRCNVDGHIIHINSIAGHIVPNVPNMNVYSASKHAVTTLTETLRRELNSIGSKIKISSISPGLVDTEIFDASCKASGKSEPSVIMSQFPALECRDIAEAVWYVLGTPQHVQVHELIIKPVGEIF